MVPAFTSISVKPSVWLLVLSSSVRLYCGTSTLWMPVLSYPKAHGIRLLLNYVQFTRKTVSANKKTEIKTFIARGFYSLAPKRQGSIPVEVNIQ